VSPFLPLGAIFTRATYFLPFWAILMSVIHFYHFETFSRVCPISIILSHFNQCDAFEPFWAIFMSATRLFTCEPFLPVCSVSMTAAIFYSVTHIYYFEPLTSTTRFYQFKPFLQVRPIFSSVTHFYHFYECDPYVFSTLSHCTNTSPIFQVWPIFTILSHFVERVSFAPFWAMFTSAMHFYHLEPFLLVRPSFTSVIQVYECDLFIKVWPIITIESSFNEWDPFWTFGRAILTCVTRTFYHFEPFVRIRTVF